MELGSYQTAWAMLHRYRSVMVRPGRFRLRGDVEVDESFLGGPEPGIPGRGALGKVLFAGAVERASKGFGRVRLGIIPNANAASLAAFLDANIEPGSHLITDGWLSYSTATRDSYRLHGDFGGRVWVGVTRGVPGSSPGVLPGEVLADGAPCKAPSVPSIYKPISTKGYFRFNRRHPRSRAPAIPCPPATSRRGKACHLPVTAQGWADTTGTATNTRLTTAPSSLDAGRPEPPWHP